MVYLLVFTGVGLNLFGKIGASVVILIAEFLRTTLRRRHEGSLVC